MQIYSEGCSGTHPSEIIISGYMLITHLLIVSGRKRFILLELNRVWKTNVAYLVVGNSPPSDELQGRWEAPPRKQTN